MSSAPASVYANSRSKSCSTEKTDDYPAAAASLTRSVALFRVYDHRPFIATALNDLGLVQQLTGDYATAAASHLEALELNRDLGNCPSKKRALSKESAAASSKTGKAATA